MKYINIDIKEALNIPAPKYMLLKDSNADVFTAEDIPYEKEETIISLPRHKAIIMLKRVGYLEKVQLEINKHGEEAIISFNNAPDIHSNNKLVNSVLGIGGIGLTKKEIDQLFIDGTSIE